MKPKTRIEIREPDKLTKELAPGSVDVVFTHGPSSRVITLTAAELSELYYEIASYWHGKLAKSWT